MKAWPPGLNTAWLPEQLLRVQPAAGLIVTGIGNKWSDVSIAGSSPRARRFDMNAGDRRVPVRRGQALAAIAEESQPDSPRAFPNAWWWMNAVGFFVSSPIWFRSV